MLAKLEAFGERMLSRVAPRMRAGAADCWPSSGNCGYYCLCRRCCRNSNGTVSCSCYYCC